MSVQTKINKNGINCHCFSPDLKMIAVAAKDTNHIEIYEISSDLKTSGAWKLIHSLKEHQLTITTLDWNIKNQILSGSHDRNVVVWNYDKSTQSWKMTLCHFSENNKHSILDGCWNNDGKKICVATGGQTVNIGIFEHQNDWWLFSPIKSKNNQSILSVKFHPSSRVVAVGAADNSFQLISCFVQNVDSDQYKGPFDEVKTSGKNLLQIKNCGGWVENVTWDQKGEYYAYTVHQNTIHIGKYSIQNAEQEIVIQWNENPFTQLFFSNESTIVAAGYETKPVIFKKSGSEWKFEKKIVQNLTSATSKVRASIVGDRMKMFEKGVVTNQQTQETQQKQDNFQHKSPIICMKTFSQNTADIDCFSTNDANGNLFFWKL